MAPTDLSELSGTAYLETGVRMHYYDVGSGADTLVLLHGFPQTSWQWRPVIEPLATADYRRLSPVSRGAGPPSPPRRHPGLAADLRADGSLPPGGYTKWELAEDA